MTVVVQAQEAPGPVASAESWHALGPVVSAESWHGLDRAFERVGRDWALVYRSAHDLPCIACRRPTRVLVSFTPRAALPICGRCRGYLA